MLTRINVSYLVSYDYELLLTSINQLYLYVDKIVLCIDKDYKTWSGNSFKIPKDFFDNIRKYDEREIIEFYFDNFYIPELTPMECESRQRNLALKKLGRGWKIQLDVDEYIYDFKSVSRYLNKYWYFTLFPKFTPILFRGILVTLYKKVSDGYLYIDNNEQFPFITNQDNNTHTRCNNLIRNFSSNIRVIHQSWAREEHEIYFKILNWGHRDDFDTIEYFNFWQSLTHESSDTVKDFHPLSPSVWDKLYYIKATDVEHFIKKYQTRIPQKPICLKKKALAKVFLKKFFRYC